MNEFEQTLEAIANKLELASERVAEVIAERDDSKRRLRQIWDFASKMWDETGLEDWADVLTMIDGDWSPEEKCPYCGGILDKPGNFSDDSYSTFKCPHPFHWRRSD